MAEEKKTALEKKRRAEIMLSAKRQFYLNGFGRTSMDAIAADAGISKGLIYHYFKSKEELLLSFSGEVMEYLKDLEQMDDPLEALRRFGIDFLVNDKRKYAEAPPIQILLTTFAGHEFDINGHDEQNPILIDFGRNYLGHFFHAGIEMNIFRNGDCREYGDIYWSFLMGKLLPVKKGNESLAPEIYIDEILSVFRQDAQRSE